MKRIAFTAALCGAVSAIALSGASAQTLNNQSNGPAIAKNSWSNGTITFYEKSVISTPPSLCNIANSFTQVYAALKALNGGSGLTYGVGTVQVDGTFLVSRYGALASDSLSQISDGVLNFPTINYQSPNGTALNFPGARSTGDGYEATMDFQNRDTAMSGYYQHWLLFNTGYYPQASLGVMENLSNNMYVNDPTITGNIYKWLWISGGANAPAFDQNPFDPQLGQFTQANQISLVLVRGAQTGEWPEGGWWQTDCYMCWMFDASSNFTNDVNAMLAGGTLLISQAGVTLQYTHFNEW